MSRGHWFAFGSSLTVAAGCAGQMLLDPPSPPEATGRDAGVAGDATSVETQGSGEDASFESAAYGEAAGASEDDGDPASSADSGMWVGPWEAGDDAAKVGADAASASGDAASAGVDAANPCDTRTFYCAAAAACCARATEYCHGPHAPMEAACVSYFDGGPPLPHACVASRTCACLADAGWGEGMCRCIDLDDAGAVGLSCFGCYGSPSARLERLLRVS
jgi:hypothetical protein